LTFSDIGGRKKYRLRHPRQVIKPGLRQTVWYSVSGYTSPFRRIYCWH